MSDEQQPMNAESVAQARKDGYGCIDLVAGVATAVTLAICATIGALKIIDFDLRRKHIPGHFLYQAFATFPAITQLVYLIPFHIFAGRKGRPGLQLGIWAGALLVMLGNAVFIFLFMWHGD